MRKSNPADRHGSEHEETGDPRIPDPTVARRSDFRWLGEANCGAVSQVLLIESRPLVGESLSRFLEATTRDLCISSISAPALIFEHPERHRRFDLVLYSIGGTPFVASSVLQEFEVLGRHLADTPLVILGDREERNWVVEALRRGARGYITSTLNPAIVIAALRLVLAGGIFIPAGALLTSYSEQKTIVCNGAQGNAESRCGELTPRESEVLALLRHGKSNKIIAYELRMCESTAKVHVRRIMQKLRATNRTQVALLAQDLHGHNGRADGAEASAENG